MNCIPRWISFLLYEGGNIKIDNFSTNKPNNVTQNGKLNTHSGSLQSLNKSSFNGSFDSLIDPSEVNKGKSLSTTILEKDSDSLCDSNEILENIEETNSRSSPSNKPPGYLISNEKTLYRTDIITDNNSLLDDELLVENCDGSSLQSCALPINSNGKYILFMKININIRTTQP